MRRKSLLNLLLLVCALVTGAGSAWADEKTEGFEKADASTTYNSTVTVPASKSDCGIAWTIYYGTVSTNDKISGSKSAQMRWYASSDTNYPYLMTTTAINGLSHIDFKARTSNVNVKMDVCYSEDGSSWTVGTTYTFNAAGTGEDVSLDIPDGNKYVKFEVNKNSTAPTSGNYKLIVDDVVFTYASDKENATWSVNPASATVMEGESTTLELTTNYDGTLSFVSGDESIATVSYDESSKIITVNGISAGAVSILVTGEATDTYNAISEMIDVTVNHVELPNNSVDIISNMGYGFYGLSLEEGDFVQPNVTSTDITDANGVTISFAKAEGGTLPRFDGAYTRFYSGNTLTVTAPEGSYLTKIVFTEPATGRAWAGSMTADTGDYVSDSKTWYATETNVSSVVLTNDGTKRIGGMEIYLMVSSVPVTVTAEGMATYVADYNLDFSAVEGLAAYKAKVEGNSITFTKVTAVPAGEGVLLRALTTLTEDTQFEVPVIAEAAELTDNDFIPGTGAALASSEEIDGVTYYNYILSKKSGSDDLGFYKANGNMVAKNRAYLRTTTAPAEGARLTIRFNDEVTGIAENEMLTNVDNENIYNLSGQRISKPMKGLFIQNGKKVIK